MVSNRRTIAYAVAASFSVLLVSVILQWLIYDDWLHETGPLRLIGSALAAVITFAFLLRWLNMERKRRFDAQRRFAMIAQSNDKIRNKLQALVAIRYLSNDGLAELMREAVDEIDAALDGIVEDARVGIAQDRSQKSHAFSA